MCLITKKSRATWVYLILLFLLFCSYCFFSFVQFLLCGGYFIGHICIEITYIYICQELGSPGDDQRYQWLENGLHPWKDLPTPGSIWFLGSCTVKSRLKVTDIIRIQLSGPWTFIFNSLTPSATLWESEITHKQKLTANSILNFLSSVFTYLLTRNFLLESFFCKSFSGQIDFG